MKHELNPFPLTGYYGPDLFCDREDELHRLQTNVLNGINTTLFSIRRMGKTGLIHHFFYTMNHKKKMHCIYIDLYATLNLKDFTNKLASAVFKAFPQQKTIGKKFLDLIIGLRPIISYDALTGEPELTFEYSQPRQYEHTLETLFSFLEMRDVPIVIAIDEFQQIVNYPEKNMEALLRTLIQRLKNVRFVFSGSSRHMLSEIFNNTKRPFFSSTLSLHLTNIAKDKYRSFIRAKLKDHKRKITDDALAFILDWTNTHTYYTQVICNRLFATGFNNITIEQVKSECSLLLNEQENIFYQYRNLLTPIQWQLLKAIAIEQKLYQPSSKHFLSKHNVGTASNVQRALDALLEKEMIYREQDQQGAYYSVYDVFLGRWLKRI